MESNSVSCISFASNSYILKFSPKPKYSARVNKVLAKHEGSKVITQEEYERMKTPPKPDGKTLEKAK